MATIGVCSSQNDVLLPPLDHCEESDRCIVPFGFWVGGAIATVFAPWRKVGVEVVVVAARSKAVRGSCESKFKCACQDWYRQEILSDYIIRDALLALD